MRFYVAEVLLALQYLHLLGYIYRDLKVLQHLGAVQCSTAWGAPCLHGLAWAEGGAAGCCECRGAQCGKGEKMEGWGERETPCAALRSTAQPLNRRTALPCTAQPENILLHHTGHVLLTDFDLSYGKGVTQPKVERKPGARVHKVRPQATWRCMCWGVGSMWWARHERSRVRVREVKLGRLQRLWRHAGAERRQPQLLVAGLGTAAVTALVTPLKRAPLTNLCRPRAASWWRMTTSCWWRSRWRGPTRSWALRSTWRQRWVFWAEWQ